MEIFIPVEEESREGRGFAFVCFDTKREAEKTVDPVDGRLCGGREIQVNMALCNSKGDVEKAVGKF